MLLIPLWFLVCNFTEFSELKLLCAHWSGAISMCMHTNFEITEYCNWNTQSWRNWINWKPKWPWDPRLHTRVYTMHTWCVQSELNFRMGRRRAPDGTSTSQPSWRTREIPTRSSSVISGCGEYIREEEKERQGCRGGEGHFSLPGPKDGFQIDLRDTRFSQCLHESHLYPDPSNPLHNTHCDFWCLCCVSWLFLLWSQSSPRALHSKRSIKAETDTQLCIAAMWSIIK